MDNVQKMACEGWQRMGYILKNWSCIEDILKKFCDKDCQDCEGHVREGCKIAGVLRIFKETP